MDLIIHDINKITLLPIQETKDGQVGTFFTRRVKFESSRNEHIEVQCFAIAKEDLHVKDLNL